MPVAIGWIAGILLWYAGEAPWIVALVAAVGGAAIFFGRSYAGFGLLAVAGGFAAATAHTPSAPPASLLNGRPYWLSATVENVSARPTSLSSVLRIDSIGTDPSSLHSVEEFNISASSLPEWIPPSPGDRFLIHTTLEPPDRGGNFPFEHNRNSFLLINGISAQTFIEGDSIIPMPPERSLSGFFAERRQAIVHALSATSLSDDAFSLLSALLVGASEDLSPELKDSFRLSGAAHALALSGFHLGVIVMLVAIAMLPLRAAYSLRRWRIVLSLCVVWLYVLLAGMPLSIVRSAAMLSVFSIARIVGRKASGFNSLCVALGVILAVEPYSLFAPGLQLSACAVAGIIAFSDPLNPFPLNRHRARRIASYIITPVSALLSTMPLSVALFHIFPTFFLLSNLVLIVFLPGVMIGGIFLLIISACGLPSIWIADAINLIVSGFSTFMEWLSSLPLSSVMLYPSSGQILLLAVATTLLAIGINILRFPDSHLQRGARVCLAACLMCIVTIPGAHASVPPEECFVMNLAGTTPLVVRSGSTVIVAPSCHPRHLESNSRRILAALDGYITASGVEKVVVTQKDFSLGSFSRKGHIFTTSNRTVALLGQPLVPDSAKVKVDYAIVCSRFNGSVKSITDCLDADTLVISRDVSLPKTSAICRESPIPTKSLRNEFLRLL